MIPTTHIHFVGIGGIGMSGLAKVLLDAGYTVSGCDRQLSHITERLAEQGAAIRAGHRADHLAGVDLLVISSAIPADNPDVAEARRREIPVVKRAELLGHLLRERQAVAVAGTHGKTTTTAMIAWILERAGLDPTIFAGGELVDLDTNAKRGQGAYAVVEADEYDYAFLELAPAVAVITNVEADHPDVFPSLDAVVQTFAAFLDRVRPGGRIIACIDDPQVAALTAHRDHVTTYGLGPAAEWRAGDITPNGRSQHFRVYHQDEPAGEFRIHLAGTHNIANALAAIAAASAIGVDLNVTREALAAFRGTRRRFEEKGVIPSTGSGQSQDITVIDDYAHHPTEIRATLKAARQRYAGRTIWAVFQPHTYSRTRAMLDEFAASFADADRVIVTDIYAARERDTLGVHAEDVVERMQHPSVHYIADLEDTAVYLTEHLQSSDVVVTLGAGDVWKVGERVLELLAEEESEGSQRSKSEVTGEAIDH